MGYYNPGSGVKSIANMATTGQLAKTDLVRYDFEIIGAGSDGFVAIEPKHVDFGTITVGFAKTLSVIIKNKSASNLYVELKMA